MKILVVDGQGGRLGAELVKEITARFPQQEIMAVGTNSVAATAMHRAGAEHAATGENAMIVGCRKADIIIGPIGAIIADALYGEISPKMAAAVGQSDAKKILIPFNKCEVQIVGVRADLGMSDLIRIAISELEGTIKA